MTMRDDDSALCAYCLHPVDDHGTTQTGCSECSCGMEPDWYHPEPARGDE